MTIQFNYDYNNIQVKGDIIGDQETSSIFFLHGAGLSNRNRFNYIRHRLFQKGYTSCAFDFPGHGETGGKLSESSLKERYDLAKKIIEKYKSDGPIVIIGASMSGYTASLLSKDFDVQSLVLIVPAAYDKAAFYLPFNKGFSEKIREENSYMQTDAWSTLKDYKGKVVLVPAEHDKVIPNPVIEGYAKAVENKNLLIHPILNSPHKVMQFLEEHKETYDDFINTFIEWCL